MQRKCVVFLKHTTEMLFTSFSKLSISHFRSNYNKNFRRGGALLYKKFAVLLKKNNLTAYQVSKDTGIAQSILSDWKNGRSNPKVDKLKILADYFGVPIEYFLED